MLENYTEISRIQLVDVLSDRIDCYLENFLLFSE